MNLLIKLQDCWQSEVARTVGIIFTGQTVNFTLNILLLPLLLSLSGPEVVGAYFIVISGVGMVSVLSSAGIMQHAKRQLPAAKTSLEKANIFYPRLLVAMFFLFCVACIGWIIFGGIFEVEMQAELPSSRVLLAYLVTITLFSHLTDYFRDTHRTLTFTTATVFYPFLFFLFCVYFLSQGEALTLGQLIILQALSSGAVALVLAIALVCDLGFKPLSYSLEDVKESIRFGIPIVGIELGAAISSSVDKFIIGMAMGSLAVGIYLPAASLGALSLVLPRVLSAGILPIISREFDRNSSNGAALVKNALKLYLFISILLFYISLFFGFDALTYYVGKDIASVSYSAMPIIAAHAALLGSSFILNNLFFIRSKNHIALQANVLGMVTTAVLMWTILAHTNLAWTASFATLGGSLILFFYTVTRLRTIGVHEVFPYRFFLWQSSIGGASFWFVSEIFSGVALIQSDIVWLPALGVSTVSYLTLTYVFARFNHRTI